MHVQRDVEGAPELLGLCGLEWCVCWWERVEEGGDGIEGGAAEGGGGGGEVAEGGGAGPVSAVARPVVVGVLGGWGMVSAAEGGGVEVVVAVAVFVDDLDFDRLVLI